MREKVTAVIPAYNEAKAIGPLLAELQAVCSEVLDAIIVVDDGSSDDTGAAAEAAGVQVLRHWQNCGYGSALKSGIRSAQTEWVLMLDADGQHRPEDALKLCEAAATLHCDMVVGHRADLIHSKLWRMPGKWLLRFMANYLTRRSIPDLNSGLRLVRRDAVMKYLHVCPSGFSFSTTITMAFLSRGYTVHYVPIKVQKRVGKSMVTVASGLDTIVLVLRIAALFNPLRLFLPLSFTLAVLGAIWGIPYLVQGHGLSVGSLMAVMTSVLLFGIGLLCDQVSQLRLERFE